MEILQAEHLTKRFTNHVALDDVSVSIPQGSIFGLLGPNGAGKTTFIRIITHITAPDSGCVVFNGHQLTQADIDKIGYLPEERGLYKKMRVGQQAMFFARLKGLSAADARRRLKEWFERLEIESWWDHKVDELSKGMAQKVQFIVTVLHEPKLLIFDEPFSGFDPINAQVLKNEILRLRDNGATVIFSTHNMESVEALCDHITLINQGHNILSGAVAEIRQANGQGRYALSYSGDEGELLQALGSRIESHEPIQVAPDGTLTTAIKAKTDVSSREIIKVANDAVNLVGFSRALPSMNEIFINTVRQNNDDQQD